MIFPASRSSGMNTHASSPARAACAETALARLPVDAQPIVVRPSACAALIAVATTRSLNERLGWETLSFLIQARATPITRASRGASTRGVKPVSSESAGPPPDRQPLEIPPHRRRARGDRRAIGKRSLRRINGIEWPEAVLAYRDRRPLLLRPAHPTPLWQDAEALVLYRGHADEVNRRS